MAGTQRTRNRASKTAGVFGVSEAEITFSTAAARVFVDRLPVGAVIRTAWVEVLTAFNAGDSNTVVMGWGAISDAENNDLVATVNEAAPGVYPGVVLDSAPIAQVTVERDVYLYYTPTGAAPTTGRARGYIVWARSAANG